ncbi:MAG: class I SAM-dependent methyltransferase [Proteobacteria bacterium]|nr:class I SAM-dependent methyltransferase [Pseudomonadota bacterium]
MVNKIRLSPRNLSEVFWDGVSRADEERGEARARLIAQQTGLDHLRAAADYNTGSINVSASWCLYSLTRHLQPARIIEVGTFIGRSTLSMAQALDDAGAPGEIHTCDLSNAIHLPWAGRTRIVQHPRTTGGDMMRTLEGAFDFVFLDGRLQPADLEALDPRITPGTVIALDDFEGVEKGVSNLMLLSRLEKLRSHILMYPPSAAWSAARGFTTVPLIAVFVPVSIFEYVRQG